MSEPAPERDDISPNLNNLPRALVEEGLGGIQRHIAESITEIAAELGNAEATMTVTYHVVANMDSVAKKLIDRPSDRDVVSNFVNCLLKHDLQIVDALVAFMEGRRQAVGVLEDFYLALVRVMWLYGPEQLSQFLEKTVVSDFESQKSLNDVLVSWLLVMCDCWVFLAVCWAVSISVDILVDPKVMSTPLFQHHMLYAVFVVR